MQSQISPPLRGCLVEASVATELCEAERLDEFVERPVPVISAALRAVQATQELADVGFAIIVGALESRRLHHVLRSRQRAVQVCVRYVDLVQPQPRWLAMLSMVRSDE